MKTRIAVIALAFTCIQSGAQNFSARFAEYEARVKTAQSSVSTLSSQSQKLKAEAAGIARTIAQAEAAVKEGSSVRTVKQCPKSNFGIQNWLGQNCTSTDQVEVPAHLQQALDDANKLKPRLVELQGQDGNGGLIAQSEMYLDAVKKARSEAITQSRDAQGKLADQLTELNSTAAQLENSLLASKLNLVNTDFILNRIQQKYDNTVIGTYMRDKMVQMVSSDTFCGAQAMCSKPKADRLKANGDGLNKELFPTQQVGKRSSANRSTSSASEM